MLAVKMNSNKPNLVVSKTMKRASTFISEPQDKEVYLELMEQVPFYNWAKANASVDKEDLLRDLASNMVPFGKHSEILFLSLIEGTENYSEEVAND